MNTIVQEEYGSTGMKQQCVVVTQHGGPNVLQVVEEDLPEPGAGEVRVKVLAAGVSAYDLMFRRSGTLPGTPRVPFTLGEDIVGVVDKLGEEVSTIEPGQMVAGATWAIGVGGGYTEFICLPASEVVPRRSVKVMWSKDASSTLRLMLASAERGQMRNRHDLPTRQRLTA